jgi:NADH dehydrogenase
MTRVLVVGGGQVGMNATRRLGVLLGPEVVRGEAEVLLVDPRSHLTYQPLLAEAAAGNIEPRHVAVPLRGVLPHAHVLTAELVGLDHPARRAVARLAGGEHRELSYDHVVLAPGSVVRALPVPGLAELGIGFKSIGEAVYLRNHLLERLAFAAATADERARERALTFVVVGGGYSGIEALGEMEDMTSSVAPVFGVRPGELRWVLVEATDRIMPEASAELARYVLRLLDRRGVEARLNTLVRSCVDGRVVLDPPYTFEADTLVWTTGVRPHPVLEQLGLPVDHLGRLDADPYLRVRGTSGAWAAGEGAAVPDLTSDTPGALCAPTAQHAVRQARRVAENIAAAVHGRPIEAYRHRYAGSVASLGRFQGAAEVYGVRVCGVPAWLLHRAYHWYHLPTVARRARVLADWALAAVFPRDIVSLGEIHDPRAPFERTFAAMAGAGRAMYQSAAR